MQNELKEKLARGQIVFGTHISSTDIQQTELIGSLGFDYLWIDMEHSQITKKELHDILIASRACKGRVSTLVRVAAIDPVLAKPVLEMGPTGIVFPGAQSAADAELATASCCYPPKGVRGFGPRACIRYGLDDINEYVKNSDYLVFKALQIEAKSAYEELDEILKNQDIDAFIIGPNDFAASFGHYRNFMHPEVMQAIDDTITRVRSAGRIAGVSIGPYDEKTVAFWIEKGVQMISVGSENAYIMNGCKAALANLKSAVANSKRG